MRIVFMGTPELSATVLTCLLKTDNEIVAVVTQPDRPKGRKGELAMSPVKEIAIRENIPVLQPEKARNPEFIAELEKYEPDIIAVAAFGQILPEAILNMPKIACINVHTSLLPKYRGASPIQWAVINGEEKTGVTIMHMAKGLDTGDIITQREVVLDEKETAGTLHDKLAAVGGELLVSTIVQLEKGTAPRIQQNDELSTYVSVLDKAMGEIDFAKPAAAIERLIRGLNPWPTAYTYVDGKSLKLWSADVVSENDDCYKEATDKAPGTVVSVSKDSFAVRCGEGFLIIRELQIEGKKRMMTRDFLLGYHMNVGDVLGR